MGGGGGGGERTCTIIPYVATCLLRCDAHTVALCLTDYYYQYYSGGPMALSGQFHHGWSTGPQVPSQHHGNNRAKQETVHPVIILIVTVREQLYVHHTSIGMYMCSYIGCGGLP